MQVLYKLKLLTPSPGVNWGSISAFTQSSTSYVL